MDAISEGKKEIFEISEAARNEYNSLKKELDDFQSKVQLLIKEVEILEHQEQISRKILLTVSKNFSKHSEENIKKAYENANQLQIKLILKRQEEKDLIKRRTDLELRLKNAQNILKRSENLISKVCVAFDFLSGDLENISDTLEDMNQRSILGRRIIQVREEEHQRIARDIHDGPAQALTNAIIKTEVCERLIDIDIVKAKNEIQELKKVLRNSIKDIRGIIYNLHPMALDDIGFIPTIQRYIHNFQSDTNIEVDFVILSQVEVEDNIKNIALFRIVQEALNNVQKHSHATMVKIKLEMTKRNLYVLVEDNGIGFNIKDLKRRNRYEGGFGLLNMQERIELLNGTFEVKSEKNCGAKVIINIPNEN
ncbi:sensor histidine kinase [Alkaliphilus sp. MSJ-5]|uniref:histidine kinase n=2 Tax=Alkaliphilus flagellatus TaxID=2841507 RepID=A0ABS6FZE5_9FIRM|nr:sensor histidine kinase [Alkaliphilus flagellatus]